MLNFSRHTSLVVAISAVLCLPISSARAQSGNGPDQVDLSNLNVQLPVPLLHRGGRGLDFDIQLVYNSNLYQVSSFGSGNAWIPLSSSMGWSLQGGSQPKNYVTAQTVQLGCAYIGGYFNIRLQALQYIDASGTAHSFNGVVQESNCPNNLMNSGVVNALATDGSGLSLSISGSLTPTITFPSGATLQVPYFGDGVANLSQNSLASIQDNNGNYISLPQNQIPQASGNTWTDGVTSGTYTDTLGNPVFTVGTQSQQTIIGADGTLQQYGQMTYPLSSGGTATITPNYSNYSVQTNFGCSGVGEYSNASVPLMSSISFPDGRSYGFTYEPGGGSGTVTGRIQKITLPSGGTVTYTYTIANGASVDCYTGGPVGFTRVLNDNLGNSWSFTYSITSQGTEILDNTTGAYSVHTFAVPASTLGPIWDYNPRQVETSTAYYDGISSTALQSSSVTFTSPNQPRGATGPFYPISSATTTNTVAVPGAASVVSKTTQYLDNLGRATELDTYDYGSGTSGPLLSKTTIQYAPLVPLYNLPAIIQRYDQNSVLDAEIKTIYDEYPVVPTSNVPNHGTGNNYGNPTTVQYLVSGSSNWLSSHATYYDTGMVATQTDINTSAVTIYSYSQCNNSLLSGTTVQVSAQMTLGTSQTWDCTAGAVNSVSDVNGNVASSVYGDPLGRVSTSTDKLGNLTTYTYPSASSNSSEAIKTFNGGLSVSDVLTTYDGFGRPAVQQTRQGPGSSNFDSLSTTYNSQGQTAWTSSPYSANASTYHTTGAGTTFQYDALGRVHLMTDAGGATTQYDFTGNDTLVTSGPAPAGEIAKSRVMEYHADGTLMSVCEVTSSLPGNGACGQLVPKNGYLTRYSTASGIFTTQQNVQPGNTGSQTRTVNLDLYGRTTSETIPELGNNGTPGQITYAYDSDPSNICPGSYPGDLVKKVDNASDVICFTYDNQHRMLTRKVVSGPFASATADAYFIYDAGNVSGTSLQNVKGTLAEAYTCTNGSNCSTRLTDYLNSAYPETANGSRTGRAVVQAWEATPSSNGYALSQGTYYPNGTLGQMQVSRPNTHITIFPTITATLDGEGRPNGMTDVTNSLTLVNGVSYSSASMATSVSYGNGDVDSQTPDPTSGRLTMFSHAIAGASPFTSGGSTAWNTDGSLHEFIWTDGNDNTQNQDCTYSNDDLKRLASVNCGSAWQQTFSYTPFGSVSKAANGGITYSANYNSATNQVASGVTASYDANGNQTMTNFVPSIGYDALGEAVHAYNEPSQTYDALGRMVDMGGNQTIYGPANEKLAIMNPESSQARLTLAGGPGLIAHLKVGCPTSRF